MTYGETKKVNMTTVVHDGVLDQESQQNQPNQQKAQGQSNNILENHRYAAQNQHPDYDCENQSNQNEAEDIESSKGSAWPSETSRLTPL